MKYAIIPRSAWGARGGRGSDVSWRLPWREAVKHTEAGPDRAPASFEAEAQAMRNIESFHIGPSRRWDGIAYSFVIFPSGRIFEGRGWGRSGAHTEGRNLTAAGVCFAGHGDKSKATPAAVGAYHWLIRHGVETGNLTADLAQTEHRDYSTKGKTCPGVKIHAQEAELNDWRQAAPVPEPEDLTMGQIDGIETRLDGLQAKLDDLAQVVQRKPVLVRDRTHKGIWILVDGYRLPFAPGVDDSAGRLKVLELLVFLGSVAAPTGDGGRNLGDKIGWIDTADLDRIPVHPDFG